MLKKLSVALIVLGLLTVGGFVVCDYYLSVERKVVESPSGATKFTWFSVSQSPSISSQVVVYLYPDNRWLFSDKDSDVRICLPDTGEIKIVWNSEENVSIFLEEHAQLHSNGRIEELKPGSVVGPFKFGETINATIHTRTNDYDDVSKLYPRSKIDLL